MATGYTIAKPGLLASKADKRYFDLVVAFIQARDADVLRLADEVMALDPSAISAHLVAAVSAVRTTSAMALVTGHLEALLASGHEMPDRLQVKYMPPLTMAAGITENVMVEVPFGPIGATLLLAEAYSARGPARGCDRARAGGGRGSFRRPRHPAVAMRLARGR